MIVDQNQDGAASTSQVMPSVLCWHGRTSRAYMEHKD